MTQTGTRRAPYSCVRGKQRFLHLSRPRGLELESDHLGESGSGESGHLLGDTKGFS